MRAWIQPGIDQGPDLTTINDPQPISEKEKKVKILYSALNHRDVWICKGQYPNLKLPCILGSDAAGIYEGKEVILNPGLAWGDNQSFQSESFHIIGMPSQGTFADAIIVDERQMYSKPEHLNLLESAAIPLAGVTAFRSLIIKCKPTSKHKILITGIGGGVALWALQYALALGCEVFVTSGSEDKIRRAKSLGAVGGVNTKEDGWEKKLLMLSGGFDIVIDSIMGNTFPLLLKLCLPGANLCFYGASAGKTENFSPHLIFWRQISIFGSTMGSDQDFQDMLDFIHQYKIYPVIDKIFSFQQFPEALERMKSQAQFGKIIIDHTL